MKDIYQVLKNLNIDYIKHDHPAVFTVEDADSLRQEIPGERSKNLFLRNKKGNKHYLVVLQADKRVDLKRLAIDLGENSLGFASDERLMKYLGCSKGSVSILGITNDENNEVKVIIDEDLWTSERVHYHPPNDNTASIELSIEELKKFIEHCGNDITVAKF